MNLLEFYKNIPSEKSPWILFEGELEASEMNCLRAELKKDRRELKIFEIKKEGPSAELEAEFLSLDMFSTAKVFLLNLKASPKDWDEHAQFVWDKLTKSSDPNGNYLFVAGEYKITEKIKAPKSVMVEKAVIDPLQWLNYYNESSQSGLKPAQLHFLSLLSFEEKSELFQYVDLWALGGDEWAAHSLGWNASAPMQSKEREPENLSYAWVDAALAQRRPQYLRYTSELIERNGEEPIRLWALLGKSIKIQAQLALGENPVGEAPFLIQKLKRIPYRPEMLNYWCECDLAMKTSRVDVLAKLMNLP